MARADSGSSVAGGMDGRSTESEVVALFRCACGGGFERNGQTLVCQACGAAVPVRDGIPRFVDRPFDQRAARTQASFGYEWTHFHAWQDSGEQNFKDYFDRLDLASLADDLVLDAGCGMGRHARQIAAYARHVVAVDFSAAVDQAAVNCRDTANVTCVQADLLSLPFADETFDFAYSIGVLHHLSDTPRALRAVVEKVKVGGRVRVYLYWKRTGVTGRLLQLVTVVRRVTTRMPFPALRAVCWALSVSLTVGVVWPYRAMTALGVRAHHKWPLFLYTRYPFRILYNDQFDRFSAPIEQRFSDEEVQAMLRNAGLDRVMTYARYGWVGEGTRCR